MSKKVLLVEDDPNLSLLYKTKFEITGFETETAQNGEEGIEKMKSWKPDLVFMDIMMPVLTGSNALIKIKQDPDIKTIPVVMLTNLSGEAEGESCLLKGAVAYLVKSDVTPKEVVAKAQEILGTSEKPYNPLAP